MRRLGYGWQGDSFNVPHFVISISLELFILLHYLIDMLLSVGNSISIRRQVKDCKKLKVKLKIK